MITANTDTYSAATTVATTVARMGLGGGVFNIVTEANGNFGYRTYGVGQTPLFTYAYNHGNGAQRTRYRISFASADAMEAVAAAMPQILAEANQTIARIRAKVAQMKDLRRVGWNYPRYPETERPRPDLTQGVEYSTHEGREAIDLLMSEIDARRVGFGAWRGDGYCNDNIRLLLELMELVEQYGGGTEQS